MVRNNHSSRSQNAQKTRRNMLKTVGGISAVATGLSYSVSAKSKDDEYDRGDQITQAATSGGSEGVKNLLVDEGLKYDVGSYKVAEGTEGDFSTNDHYFRDGAELSVWAVEADDEDVVWLTSVIEFGGSKLATARTAWHAMDAIGVTFDSNHWTQVGTPSLGSMQHNPSWYSGSVGNDALAGEVDLVHDGGLKPKLPSDTNVSLTCKLKHTGGPRATMWGHYDHTIAFVTGGSISISASLGVFDVSVGGGGKVAWSAGKPVDPSKAMG